MQIVGLKRPAPTASASASEDHGYLTVNHAEMGCRYRAVRRQDLLESHDGRDFDALVTSLVQTLIGPGAVDPFDTRTGFLFEGRIATTGEKLAARGPTRHAVNP
jgi:hypothetical protein